MELTSNEGRLNLNQVSTPSWFQKKKNFQIAHEDLEIIESLYLVERDLKLAHRNYDMTNNDVLLDSFTYEIMALNKRYEYYLNLCKAKGLIADGF